jgi:hypothetical protein
MRVVPEDEEKGSNKPHPDYVKNFAQFSRMIQNVYWKSEFLYEIDAPEGHRYANYSVSDTCVIFSYGIKGKPKLTKAISFHQKNKDYADQDGFAFELSSFFNLLGFGGFLSHRLKNFDGSKRIQILPEQQKGERMPNGKDEKTVLDKDGNVCRIAVWIDVDAVSRPKVELLGPYVNENML